jgi:hypothetical protein
MLGLVTWNKAQIQMHSSLTLLVISDKNKTAALTRNVTTSEIISINLQLKRLGAYR